MINLNQKLKIKFIIVSNDKNKIQGVLKLIFALFHLSWHEIKEFSILLNYLIKNGELDFFINSNVSINIILYKGLNTIKGLRADVVFVDTKNFNDKDKLYLEYKEDYDLDYNSYIEDTILKPISLLGRITMYENEFTIKNGYIIIE